VNRGPRRRLLAPRRRAGSRTVGGFLPTYRHAGSIGTSGRTIRRIEAVASGRSRDITLTTLAGHYGMSAEFLRWIARETETGPALEERLRHRAELSGL
jgi:hypothetical protein